MRTKCRSGRRRIGVSLGAKAFAPASCFPSSLRRVTSHKFTKFVRRSGEAFSGAAPQGRGEQTLKLIRSAVFPESSWFADFLLMRGCQRLGQPIEKPTSPRPSGTGIFPYSRMPALKCRPIFKAPLRGASRHRAIRTGFREGDLLSASGQPV